MAEQGTHNPLVAGSSPAGPTSFSADQKAVIDGLFSLPFFPEPTDGQEIVRFGWGQTSPPTTLNFALTIEGGGKHGNISDDSGAQAYPPGRNSARRVRCHPNSSRLVVAA